VRTTPNAFMPSSSRPRQSEIHRAAPRQRKSGGNDTGGNTITSSPASGTGGPSPAVGKVNEAAARLRIVAVRDGGKRCCRAGSIRSTRSRGIGAELFRSEILDRRYRTRSSKFNSQDPRSRPRARWRATMGIPGGIYSGAAIAGCPCDRLSVRRPRGKTIPRPSCRHSVPSAIGRPCCLKDLERRPSREAEALNDARSEAEAAVSKRTDHKVVEAPRDRQSFPA